ncbi:MAG: flagellin [Phycisphaerae bacterium]|jgi:flagellin
MARINSNVAAVVAQRHLNTSYRTLNSTLERLSTGLRINHGKDDPAGLIVSEHLRAEVGAVSKAITNTQRAGLIIATTEGALDEVSSLLSDIQGLIIEAANEGALSEDEIKANQLQIDSAISSIERIANSTTFAGRYLLNGTLDYVTSGVSVDNVVQLAINGAQFGSRPYVPVRVDVTTSAQHAELYYPNGVLTSAVTLEIQGNLGVTTLSFGSGTTASMIVQGINAVADSTGVNAVLSADPTAGFYMQSEGLGSRQFVSVKALPGGGPFEMFDVDGSAYTRDYGRDAGAAINGAECIGDGNRLTLKTSTLDIELTLANHFGLGQTEFAITEGGALFQVGPRVNTNLQVNIGVQSIAPSRLGNASLGYLSQVKTGEENSLVAGEYTAASRIVDEAIRQVSILRGRLGAFERNTLQTNMNQLGITMENLVAAESTIRDADFAYETSQLTRNQVLVNAGTASLSIANQTPQMVLSLLGG